MLFLVLPHADKDWWRSIEKKIQSDLSRCLISTDWIWTEWKTPRRHHVQHVILWVTLMTCAWKKPVTATTATTDTTAKNKDTLYYYSFDVTWNPKISSNCAQTGKESKPPTPKAQRGKRSKGPVERVSYKELERAIIYSNMNHSLGFCHVIIMWPLFQIDTRYVTMTRDVPARETRVNMPVARPCDMRFSRNSR